MMNGLFTHTASIRSLFSFVVLLFAGVALAQPTPIMTEDFGGGAPMGWTTSDLSGGVGVWTWCDDPAQAIGDGCVNNWAAYSNQHDGAFLSATGSNGFMVMDSDALGGLGTNHQVVLNTTSMDFSMANEVWLKFESLIGVFGVPTLDNAVVRVSLDNTNWTTFNFVDIVLGASGNPGVERWTVNPEITVLDISSVAANQGTVYIQWFWEGNYEYYWLLDDLAVYDEDPSQLFFPLNDMQVDPFFSIAPNAQTPAGQEVPISFLADVSNQGLNNATGVDLTVTVNDGATDVFTESFTYGAIEADSVAENQSFAGTFTPSGPAGTVYTATYSIASDSTDEQAGNDSQSFIFMSTDSTFAKEMGATRGVLPADSNWDAGEAHSWGFGNYFQTPNGAGKFARTVTFGINNAADIMDQILFLKLYLWDDADANNNAEASERTELANTLYQVTGSEVANELMTMKWSDLSGVPVDIPLIDGGRYIVAMEFVAPNDLVTVNMASSDDFNYSAQVFQDITVDMEAQPYLATMIIVNDPINTEAYEQGGFGDGIVPCLRFSVGDESLTTAKEILGDHEVSLTPNPASDFIQLSINLEEPAQGLKGKMLTLDGKVVRSFAFGDVQQMTETISVSELPAGSYFLHLSNKNVSATKRFMIVK
ncbi:MAG: T9SS type A sorting domain-containing protein [Saprospiraceae bacterium]|nr:T9SS type A sorting domain-containing protein [Saprospiraceae bacterium]